MEELEQLLRLDVETFDLVAQCDQIFDARDHIFLLVFIPAHLAVLLNLRLGAFTLLLDLQNLPNLLQQGSNVCNLYFEPKPLEPHAH